VAAKIKDNAFAFFGFPGYIDSGFYGMRGLRRGDDPFCAGKGKRCLEYF